MIPKQIQSVLETLRKQGFEAYIVGGCVRDTLRDQLPKDWDITTNATPEQIQNVFKKSGNKTFYENKFGTVTVLTDAQEPSLKELEITPFRTETKYTDKRHPDEIKWAKKLKDDLSRRDFTVNAIAMDEKGKIIDNADGQKDLKNNVIRTVGKPEKRFAEDALRMMRAVRFTVCLGPSMWEIEEKTAQGIINNAKNLKLVSKERIRDELVKIIQSPRAGQGIELLRRLKLLQYIIPELELGFNVPQNKHHIYQVYQHNILSLQYAAKQGYSLHARIAALLHDIGKPQTKRGTGENTTFYNHEIVGARITNKILKRLKFSNKDTEKITKLVRWHLFYYNVDEVGTSSVRRLLRKVGKDDIEELLQVRYCDRIGSSVPKAEPYKLRHLKYLLDKVSQDPIAPSMLKISGDEIMKMLDIKPGPKIGHILSYLLSYVLSDPKYNTKEFLTQKVEELGKLPDPELKKLAEKAKKEINQITTKKDTMTKQKYWVS
ncbi:MAG: HD domain-containing protein [Parcubacteria group bacterium]|nr:HD domain-containing protein [Parcubacteria group bacterium]